MSADRWVLVSLRLMTKCIDHLPYKSAIFSELKAALAAAPAAPEPHIDGRPLYSGLPPAAPAAEPVGWISVKNQMPPPNSDCLVWFEGDRIGLANTFTKWRHHSHPLGYLIQGHGGSHDSVTHWMPLPAAPGAAPAQSREPLTLTLTDEQIDAAVNAWFGTYPIEVTVTDAFRTRMAAAFAAAGIGSQP